jgi:hypothetical protein
VCVRTIDTTHIEPAAFHLKEISFRVFSVADSRLRDMSEMSILVGSICSNLHDWASEDAWDKQFKPSTANSLILKEALDLLLQRKYDLMFLTIFKGIEAASLTYGPSVSCRCINKVNNPSVELNHKASSRSLCFRSSFCVCQHASATASASLRPCMSQLIISSSAPGSGHHRERTTRPTHTFF